MYCSDYNAFSMEIQCKEKAFKIHLLRANNRMKNIIRYIIEEAKKVAISKKKMIRSRKVLGCGMMKLLK